MPSFIFCIQVSNRQFRVSLNKNEPSKIENKEISSFVEECEQFQSSLKQILISYISYINKNQCWIWNRYHVVKIYRTIFSLLYFSKIFSVFHLKMFRLWWCERSVIFNSINFTYYSNIWATLLFIFSDCRILDYTLWWTSPLWFLRSDAVWT